MGATGRNREVLAGLPDLRASALVQWMSVWSPRGVGDPEERVSLTADGGSKQADRLSHRGSRSGGESESSAARRLEDRLLVPHALSSLSGWQPSPAEKEDRGSSHPGYLRIHQKMSKKQNIVRTSISSTLVLRGPEGRCPRALEPLLT